MMEILGILLSVPAALIASAIYSFVLSRAQTRWPRFTRFLFRASVVVLVGLAVEVILLAVFGAVRSRELFGPGFVVAHVALFLLGVPSLATLLVITGRGRWLGRWYVVAPLCTVFAFGLVLLQYFVAESLYGIDGIGGPFSGGGG
jgi:hypothetical protein